MRRLRSILLLTLALVAPTIPSHSQSTDGPSFSTPNDPKNPEPTLRVTSRLVTVDVVVRKDKKPVTGLQQGDFALFEDGVKQTIRYFEPHFSDETVASVPTAAPPSLPPDTWTNLPIAHATDSVTVLLLDGLNTRPEDVVFVRREMVSYLKKSPPGRRIAVFALGGTLRMLQGFTADTGQLLIALQKGSATSPTSLLPPEDQTFQERAELDGMREGGVSAQDIANTQNFMSDVDTAQTAMRVGITLGAMQQLSRYLAGIPGRKNLVWFSGSFPLQFFSVVDIIFNGKGGNTQVRQQTLPTGTFDQELRETADMLVAARVAVYPVDARGVLLEPMYSSTQQTDYAKPRVGPGRFGDDQQISQHQLAAEHATEDVLAQQTGGRAVHDSNGLQEAMADALDDGSNFYTLAYIPTNSTYNGAQRNILIRLTHGKDELFYRRSYYADAGTLTENGAKQDSRTIFLESMQRGVPTSSQIVFDVRVAAPDPKPLSGSVAGANSAMKNRVARYSIDYAASLDTIHLIQSSSGVRQGHIDALAIAYGRFGNRLNWVGNDVPIALDQSAWDKFSRYGLQIHQILDLPAGEVYLRVGLHDPGSGRIGTFEIPLHVPTKN
jgi:VWFA-related protein